jgi:hypothetical protein
MEVTVPVGLLVIGAICLVAALFGGISGTWIFPTLNPALRVVAAVLALLFIASGVGAWAWTESRKEPDKTTSSAPTTPPTTTSTNAGDNTQQSFVQPGQSDQVQQGLHDRVHRQRRPP